MWPFTNRKESATTGALVRHVLSQTFSGIFPKASFRRLSKEGFEENVTAYACIMAAGRAVSGVPWCAYERSRTGRGVKKYMTVSTAAKAYAAGGRSRKAVEMAEVEDHRALRVLEKPNPLNTGSELFEAIECYLLLGGMSFTEIVSVRGREVGELWVHSPEIMRIVPDAVDRVGGYVADVNGTLIPFEREEIMYLKLFSPRDDWYGWAPLMSAAKAIDIDNTAALWNYNLLKNDARPPGAFSTDEVLPETSYERLKANIRKMVAGAANARRPLLLDGGLKWLNFGYSPGEMDWLGGKRAAKLEICQGFATPPEIIGDSENKTYSNYKEARKAHYQDRVLPDLDKIRDGLNNNIAPRYGDRLWFDYDRDQIEALQEDQGMLYDRAERSTFISINEKRSMTGWDDVEGGDVILVNSGMVPLESVGGDSGVDPSVQIENRPRRELPPAEGDPAGKALIKLGEVVEAIKAGI